ncbi:hypothetical protein F5I97DRAFT_817102 [Phlebopus sp. FC_14]|nr:hypothetical protein F5I97DRAFT_817102 [Phlebopus sp. FC_14]
MRCPSISPTFVFLPEYVQKQCTDPPWHCLGMQVGPRTIDISSTTIQYKIVRSYLHFQDIYTPRTDPANMGNSSSKSRKRKSQFGAGAARRSAAHDAPPPYSQPSSSFQTHQNEYLVTDSDLEESEDLPPPLKDVDKRNVLMGQESHEDALETLRKYDTVIVMDDSGSMEGSSWEEAKNALAGLARYAAEYDADGIDVYFLNNSKVARGMKDAEQVHRLFRDVRPRGYTPTGTRLEGLLNEYIDDLERAKAQRDQGNTQVKPIKPVNFLVITDGEPTDDPQSVIVAAAHRLDAGHFPLSQVGIQFVQIGDSQSATRALKALDDDLHDVHKIRDIVDTTPYSNVPLTDDLLVKVLLGGINRRVDNHGAKAVMAS